MDISGWPEIRANTLYLNSSMLNIKWHNESHIQYVLEQLGHDAIVNCIEESYKKSVSRNPDAEVSRPSVFAMNLGTDEHRVLSGLGSFNRTSIHRSSIELQPPIRRLGDIIHDHGFTPEVRSRLGSRAAAYSALYLRNPETDPAPITPIDNLPAALGFVEPGEFRHLRPKLRQAFAENDLETYLSLFLTAAEEGEAAVNRQGDSYGQDSYGYAQIGFTLSKAILQAEIQGEAYMLKSISYEQSLLDAETYAYNMRLDEVAAVLGQEIDRIRSLKTQR